MGRQILEITANEQTLNIANPFEVSTDKVNYIEARFTLGQNWSGYDSVRAVWFNDYQTISTVLSSDGICAVPFEVLKRRGKVYVNLVGTISDGDVVTDRLTSFPVLAGKVTCQARITGGDVEVTYKADVQKYIEKKLG